jgi:hypothetical protein
VTTRAGLIGNVKVVAVRIVAGNWGVGGLLEVLKSISWGFDRVICNWLYVPGGTLAVLTMFVKPVKRPKSTVAGVGAESGGFADQVPLCGPRFQEVMVSRNDSTLQMGVSVPKRTTEPGVGF